MYIDDYPACESTFASLGIFHDTLDPHRVSHLLSLDATRAWKRGESRNPRARRPIPAKSGGWVLSTEGVLQSRDVRRHIDWLLDQVEPKREVLRSLQAEGYRTDIRCYWSSALGQGGPGPILSPVNLARLAALGLELSFDVYFPAEEDSCQSGRSHEPVVH